MMHNLQLPGGTLFMLSCFIAAVLVGCTSPNEPDCSTITGSNADDCIRMNQIQVIGTHNSYKLYPHPELVRILDEVVEGWADNIMYEHQPLQYQLEELGVRQFELDIFADPEGGLFSEPAGALLAGDSEFIRHPEMMQPGFKTLHVQDTDYRSNCLTFVSCLVEIRDWSLQNPDHVPIMVLVEVKDRTRDPINSFYFTEPVPIREELLDELDQEIRSVFAENHLITPDVVRGEFETLEEAIRVSGWPTLRESRGKIVFALDNLRTQRDEYLKSSDVLENRVMFVSSEPGNPSAAFVKVNNVLGNYERIQELVADGFIVRTRSDSPGREALTGDTTRRDMAFSSGAQYISTDYPEAAPFPSAYIVRLPDTDGPARCNPISAPEGCRSEWLFE